MSNRNSIFAALLAAVAASSAIPAAAADGEILITQAKALAGNVTPGDTPGYPVTLSKTGSYKLGSNLFPTANTDGIDITAAFVTVNLNGFALNGGKKAKSGIIGSAPLGSRIRERRDRQFHAQRNLHRRQLLDGREHADHGKRQRRGLSGSPRPIHSSSEQHGVGEHKCRYLLQDFVPRRGERRFQQ